MVKLIDANKLFQETEENMHNSPHSDPTHTAMHKHEHCHFLCEIDKQPEIDPVHAANACYCKECWYYTKWGECKEFGDIMKPDDFCSRGVPKNVQM